MLLTQRLLRIYSASCNLMISCMEALSRDRADRWQNCLFSSTDH